MISQEDDAVAIWCVLINFSKWFSLKSYIMYMYDTYIDNNI